jgi:type II secretory pathway pseudopilin PulG
VSPLARRAPFTRLERIIVIVVAVILAGLIFFVLNGITSRGPRASRVDGEIMALSVACEAYKTDHGEYPQDKTPGQGSVTNSLDASTHYNPASYVPACNFLYVALSGDSNGHGERATNYAPDFFKTARLGKDANGRTYIVDPYGNSYGYSTAGMLLNREYMASLATNTSVPKPARNSVGTVGYNNTFDLWSTGGTKGANASDTVKWIKNW